MNIVQIIPGSGGSFYCGNCMRDSKFEIALRNKGHNIVKIPMYLPIFSDKHDIKDIPVFYGAISIYLKQLYPIFRKAPRWLDTLLLNSRPLMKIAASMAGSTDAKGLEEMTVSMLLGEDGQQSEELEYLVNWMYDHIKPDVVHISNALLLGLAHRIKEKLNVPVVCSLQDEDVWVDAMKPLFRDRIWQLMSEKAKHVDMFIGVSHYFSEVMQRRMNLPAEKIHGLYLGVDPDDYKVKSPSLKGRNIGYISRMCHENGLDITVDAFIQLKKRFGYEDVNLILTGGYTGSDLKYIKALKKRILEAGLQNQTLFLTDFEETGKELFFDQVVLISVPVRNGEAFGMYLLESMASGVPVVQPALGAFPEIVELSEGGIVYKPNHPDALCNAWAEILDDPQKLESMSVCARHGIEKNFNIHDHAKEMINYYYLLNVDNQ